MATARTNAPPPPPTAAAAPPAATPAPAAAPTSRPRDLAARLREAAAGTPGTMRLLGLGCVVVLVVFGILGAITARSRDDAISTARDEAAQLVRLQTIRTSLVQADAQATNAFLVGGLEPSEQRSAYDTGIATAANELAVAAANSHPSDSAALRGVNESLTTYTGLVESARANNRQGFPVGAAYQRQASTTVLRGEILPVLTELSDVTQSRVKDAYRDSRTSTEGLVTGALLAVVVLVITQAYLTVRTRRLVSVPLLVSAGIVVVATALAGVVLLWSQQKADDVRDGDYREATALAQARIFAFDAKSAESLTLIARGSGAGFEQQFQSLSSAALTTMEGAVVGADVIGPFEAYLDVHTEIRNRDDDGNWDGAVELATQAEGGANAAFTTFSEASGEALGRTASSIEDDLDEARTPLPALAVVLVLAGVAAAVAAWQGVSVRLKEYR